MTFDAQIQSITQDHIVPKVTDNVLQSNVLSLLLLSNGKPWAGESLKFPVKLSSHTQGGSFDDYSEFSVANENVRQVASFDPRAYYQSVVIGGIAKSVNSISKSRVLDLVKVEMESVHQDMVDDIGTLLYGLGTGNSNKDFLGVRAGVDDGNNVATYGNLSRSTYSAWQSSIQTSVGAFDFAKARTLHNSATVGNRKPNIDVCNETVFGYVEADYTATVQGNYNVMEGARARLSRNGIQKQAMAGLTGHAGFDVLYYAGTPIVKDDKSTSGYLFSLNTEFMGWYGVKAKDANPVDLKAMYHDGNDYDGNVPSSMGFAWTGFVRPAKQYAYIGQFLLIGNLLTPAPRLHSHSAGISS